MTEQIHPLTRTQDTALLEDVSAVCRRIPPLWNLPNYVAVNPFLGFRSVPLAEAAGTIEAGLDARVLPDLEYYRLQWRRGAFGRAELSRAAARLGYEAGLLERLLSEGAAEFRPNPRTTLTFAERFDRENGTAWHPLGIGNLARWCAVYFSADSNNWRPTLPGTSMFSAWREAAAVDCTLEIAGLSGWREWIRTLPETPLAALSALLERLEVAPEDRLPYFYRLLGGIYGWASYARCLSWQNSEEGSVPLAELLAIRACYDAGITLLAQPRRTLPTGPTSPELYEDPGLRLVLQEALEDAYTTKVLSQLSRVPWLPTTTRPTVQAVFCIDVRSEPLRDALEAVAPEVETYGFAGFFGVALQWNEEGDSSARCPVLLKPAVSLQTGREGGAGARRKVVKHLQSAPASAFSAVELTGLVYGASLLVDALALRTAPVSREPQTDFVLEPDGCGHGIELAQQVEMAAGILKNMGLRGELARIVLLCGHTSRSANNPHAAGLECGACGGHGGALNARVAAAMLNSAPVRKGLAARGWHIPLDTWFLPALHQTSTDEVSLLDLDQLPESHHSDLTRLQSWLVTAEANVRRERSPALGLSETEAGRLHQLLRLRSRDWSEVRPEWGLARNAAFIAAPRSRTRGVNLEGRAFLHEYDWTTDADLSVLTLILSAPMVVASWINLQYFASTVDNEVFGCGTKALHNRVGTLGVVLGNSGDLRTGLAKESVHASDGSWFHEPLRLQVIVEAPRERVEAVLAAQAAVQELIRNGWVRLFVLDPRSGEATRWLAPGRWEE